MMAATIKDLLQKGALVFGATLFALVLAETFAWFAPDQLVPRRVKDLRDELERKRNAESFITEDRDLLFKIKPNQNFLVHHPDYTMRVVTHLNLPEIGFRGGILGGPAWGAAVGDSFTFAQGVDDQSMWTSLLSRSLGKEVINFGVPAQGPAQYTRILKRYALPMRPQIVFYGFYFNDLDSAVRFHRTRRGIPVSRYLRNYSVVYNLFQGGDRSNDQQTVFFKANGVEFDLQAEGLRRNLERQNEKFDDRWDAVSQEIDEAIKASNAVGVTFVLLYFPSRWEVYWEQIQRQLNFPKSLDIDRLHRRVLEYCGVKKINCLDLTPALKQEADQRKQLYFRTDGHWNQEGNRVVAEAIRAFIAAKGFANL